MRKRLTSHVGFAKPSRRQSEVEGIGSGGPTGRPVFGHWRTPAEVRSGVEPGVCIVGPYPGISSWDLNIVNRYVGVAGTPDEGRLGAGRLECR